MNLRQLAGLLLREQDTGAVSNDTVQHRKLSSFLDRLICRLWVTNTALVTYFQRSRIDTDSGEIEMIFNEFPDEVQPVLRQLSGTRESSLYKFRDEKTGHKMLGLKIKPTEDDLDEL